LQIASILPKDHRFLAFELIIFIFAFLKLSDIADNFVLNFIYYSVTPNQATLGCILQKSLLNFIQLIQLKI